MSSCVLCELNEENPTFIKDFEFWTLLVNYMQPTLGSNLIVLNRHVSNLSDLTEKESLEHLKIVKELEEVLRNSFNPEKIDYLMLANVVEHIHYHVVPRYRKPKFFQGYKWEDKNYGHIPKLSSDKKSQQILDNIIFEIQKGFDKFKF